MLVVLAPRHLICPGSFSLSDPLSGVGVWHGLAVGFGTDHLKPGPRQFAEACHSPTQRMRRLLREATIKQL